jgi:hypothetical protein
MFKVNHLFGGNGSVPSIGGVPSLSAALAAVSRAEDALAAARSLAKAAARREGKGVRNLFSEGKFVARASAEKWVDQARAEGLKAGVNFLADSVERVRNPDPADPLYHLAVRLKRDGMAPLAAMERWHEEMEKAGFFSALGAGDYDKAAEIWRAHSPEVSGKAAQIVAAGRKARMSVDATEVPDPPKGTVAAQIIQAGRRRRNEV